MTQAPLSNSSYCTNYCSLVTDQVNVIETLLYRFQICLHFTKEKHLKQKWEVLLFTLHVLSPLQGPRSGLEGEKGGGSGPEGAHCLLGKGSAHRLQGNRVDGATLSWTPGRRAGTPDWNAC